MVARVDPFLRAFLAAGVVHGAVIATVLSSIPPEDHPARAVEPQAAAVALIDIDISSAETISDQSPPESDVAISGGVAPSHPRSRSPSGRGAGAAYRKEATPAGDPVESVDLGGATTEPAARAGSEIEAAALEPSLSLDQLGLEGPNRLSLRTFKEEHSAATEGVGPAGHAPSPERVVQSMRQLAQEHDRKLGLGADGPVATALEKAAYGTNVTLDGHATFKVVVIGNVVSTISLVPSGAEKRSAWNEVAKTALAQLAGRRVRVPPGSRGVVLHIQVVSRAALPSGHDPGLEISVGTVVIQRGRGKRSAKLAFLEPDAMLGSAIDPRGGSAARGGVNFVRTDIDPVDVGAKDRQVVHTYTLDETALD